MHSLHKRDVTCVDTTLKNNLVTGSVDNLICFWNTFTATITKSINIPSYVVESGRGSSICSLKFAE